MLERLEWLLVGLSGLFELVLLLLLCQPINRKYAAPWLKWLVGGAFLFHLGYFGRLFFFHEKTDAAHVGDRAAMFVLCCGLLIMPSAMLHAALHLRTSLRSPSPATAHHSRLYWILYLPLGLLLPALYQILTGPRGDFMESVQPIQPIYIGWLATANAICTIIFIYISISTPYPNRRRFFVWISSLLILFTIAATAYVLLADRPEWEYPLRIGLAIAPLLPSVVLVCYVISNRLLPVVFEQTTVYGGVLVGGLFTHQLLAQPVANRLRSYINVDFVVLELAVVVLLIYWIKPLRRRASESLRFLMSPKAFQVRDAIRELALEVTQQTSPDIQARCEWFAEQLRNRFELTWVRILYLDAMAPIESYREFRVQDPDPSRVRVSPYKASYPEHQPKAVLDLLRTLVSRTLPLERGGTNSKELEEAMDALDCDVAFPMNYQSIRGAILFGNDKSFLQLADEQLTSLLVLVDQFAATLQNLHEERLRRSMERDLFQKEKLSTLGMISGTLAHELRNPLSSIRTIASLVAEETPNDSPHLHDVNMIVSEVDRLHLTLQRVLEFARLPEESNSGSEPDRIISKIGSILSYYALQRGVVLEFELGAAHAIVAGSEQTLNEVFMNLVKNAIEACAECAQAKVKVITTMDDESFQASVIDNGKGIAPEDQDCIFDAFVTYKESGTGLGLYIVRERVQELGGSIQLHSSPNAGATFKVSLPRTKK